MKNVVFGNVVENNAIAKERKVKNKMKRIKTRKGKRQKITVRIIYFSLHSTIVICQKRNIVCMCAWVCSRR